MGSNHQIRCFHYIIKHSSPPLIITTRVIIKETKYLLSLCIWFIFLRWLLKSLPPITSIGVKIVSPILNVDVSSSLALSGFSFKVVQYWLLFPFSISSIVILDSIHYQKNVSAWLDKSNTRFLINLSPVKPPKYPKYGRGNTWYIPKYLTKNWG